LPSKKSFFMSVHMVSTFLFALFLTSCQSARSQPAGFELEKRLFEAYERYREPGITERRFKHSDVEPLVRQLPEPFRVEQQGASIEGRAIYSVQLGSGPVQVLLWSQMHGDEATATMALLDLFRFFQASGDGFDDLRQRILDQTTLTFIPLLNPDGADRFTRRNALGVDLNRDALRLQCPESRILKRLRDELDADWGFNLHDQNRYYAAGTSDQTASVSFLAPAYNYAKEVNKTRGAAMQLIVHLNELLQQYIPGQVARYDDAFEPRAFGDNIQKWGTRTILIESGGLKGDPEKQYLRKLHFVALLSAFRAIASGSWQQKERAAYEDIPYNNSNAFHDLLVREVELAFQGETFVVDLAFRIREVDYDGNRKHYPRASITDLGDLSTYHAYQDIPAAGYRAVPGRIYSRTLGSVRELTQLDVPGLLRSGITTIPVRRLPKDKSYRRLPIELALPGKTGDNDIHLYGNPSFTLQKDGQVIYAVINGRAYAVKEAEAIRKQVEEILGK